VVFPVAERIDGREQAGLKARALGFASAIPWPVYGGDTWFFDEPTACYLAELDLVDQHLNDGKLGVSDIAFLSDIGRSAVGPAFLADNEAALLPDPLATLRIEGLGAGVAAHSMTLISLLESSDVVSDTASANLIASGSLVDPRLVLLAIDESNTMPPWWTDLYMWTRVIGRWREVNVDHFDPGFVPSPLLDQFQRSLDWDAYADPNQVSRLRQEQEAFDSLRRFLEDGTS
jgi:hypothetical protein